MSDQLREKNRKFSDKRDDLTGKFNELDFVTKASVFKFPYPKRGFHENTLVFHEKRSSYIVNVKIRGYTQQFELKVKEQNPFYESEIRKYLPKSRIRYRKGLADNQ